MLRFIFLSILTVLTFSSLAGENPVFKAKGNTYSLTGFVEIRSNGRIIYKDKEIKPWSKQNSYSQLSHGPFTFITIKFNDGLDIDHGRLFSIKGDAVVEYPILTSNDENELFIKSGNLYYWSESFCGFKNPGKKIKQFLRFIV
jgi:hypothetical protein